MAGSIARANHWLLYVVLIIMPVTGYIGSKAGGFLVPWFWLFETPDWVGKNEDLNTIAENVHAVTAYVLLGLISLHVAAAFWHHIVRKDVVLRRMLPFG